MIDCDPLSIAPILACSYAVWKYRRPAQASVFTNSLPWLVDIVSDHSMAVLATIIKPSPKLKKHMDPDFIEKETIEHNEIVSECSMDSVFVVQTGQHRQIRPKWCWRLYFHAHQWHCD